MFPKNPAPNIAEACLQEDTPEALKLPKQALMENFNQVPLVTHKELPSSSMMQQNAIFPKDNIYPFFELKQVTKPPEPPYESSLNLELPSKRKSDEDTTDILNYQLQARFTSEQTKEAQHISIRIQ